MSSSERTGGVQPEDGRTKPPTPNPAEGVSHRPPPELSDRSKNPWVGGLWWWAVGSGGGGRSPSEALTPRCTVGRPCSALSQATEMFRCRSSTQGQTETQCNFPGKETGGRRRGGKGHKTRIQCPHRQVSSLQRVPPTARVPSLVCSRQAPPGFAGRTDAESPPEGLVMLRAKVALSPGC